MKNIALLVKIDTDEGIKCAIETIGILSSLDCNLYIAYDYSELFGNIGNVIYVEKDRLYDNAECVIVFGGDGTIMRAAHSTDLPILAVNLGRIGYLAELEPNELGLLTELVDDNFTLSNRMMLRCIVQKNNETSYETNNILNEIVLSKGESSDMPEIELYCIDQEVGKYIADGLICATPTGSTAYSLAAGGPIVDPHLSVFCISHICPQSFYAKPLIINGLSTLTFYKGKRAHGRLELFADGEHITEIEDGDSVFVSRSEKETRFIKIKQNNSYSVMRSKMTEI